MYQKRENKFRKEAGKGLYFFNLLFVTKLQQCVLPHRSENVEERCWCLRRTFLKSNFSFFSAQEICNPLIEKLCLANTRSGISFGATIKVLISKSLIMNKTFRTFHNQNTLSTALHSSKQLCHQWSLLLSLLIFCWWLKVLGLFLKWLFPSVSTGISLL